MLARRWHCRLMFLLMSVLAFPATAESYMPDAVAALLKKHRVAASQIGVVVRRLDDDLTLITHRADKPFNPASVIKLATAVAAIDLLGPDHRWRTRIATDGKIKGDALNGNLYLIGGGDPYLTVERFLYLLNGLRDRGIRTIHGDVIIDDSIFNLPPHNPAAFDGVPHKAYNVGASGLAVNYKAQSVILFPAGGGVRVFTDPPNDHFTVNNQVKLSRGRCRNWRRKLREILRDDGQQASLTVRGSYPKSCGEQSFYLSVLEPSSHVAGVFKALWRRVGGGWEGDWRSGRAPDNVVELTALESPPLGEVLVAMNKFSNNVIARHIFLSLSPPPHTLEGARQVLQEWLTARGVQGVQVDNGSGLSRSGRISAANMDNLLDFLWRHPYRAEVVASLPILGLDGTLRKRLRGGSLVGNGHLKTGSLRNVKAISGFFRDARGRSLSMVFFSNGVSSVRAKRLQDDIFKWAYQLP